MELGSDGGTEEEERSLDWGLESSINKKIEELLLFYLFMQILYTFCWFDQAVLKCELWALVGPVELLYDAKYMVV